MRLFRWKKKKKPTQGGRTITDWTSCEIVTAPRYSVKVVGTSYHQDTLHRLWDTYGPRKFIDVVLVPEPENPHDQNAIAVMAINENNWLEHIGYIDKETAAASVDAMGLLPDGMTGFACRGRLKTNPAVEDSLIGVRLNLPLAVE